MRARIGSQDLTATRSFLSEAGVMPVYEDDDLYCVGPDDALGAYLLFHDKGIDAPWVSPRRATVEFCANASDAVSNKWRYQA